MAKEKVYKLAQEFKVSSEALVQMLRQMGIPVKSHMSTVDDNLRDEIKKKFESERAEIKKEYERKKQMIVKAKEDLLTKVEKPEPVVPPPVVEVKKPSPAPAAVLAAEEQREKDRKQRNREFAAAEYRGQEQSPRIKTMAFMPVAAPVGGVAGAPPSSAGAGGGESRSSFKKGKKKGGKKKVERPEVDEMQLRANVKKTLARIGSGSERKKYKKEARPQEEGATEEKKILNVSEFVTVAEMANMMQSPASEVIAKCLELGLFVTINQRLDFETIELVADEFRVYREAHDRIRDRSR